MLKKLGYDALEVRTPFHLEHTDALIIPGGESTTILNLFEHLEFRPALKEYVKHKKIMGTCAGLIVLARSVNNLPFEPLGLIDIEVERNAYGRQRESFIDKAKIQLNGKVDEVDAVFIRAPKIVKTGDDVRIVGRHKGNIVAAENDRILVCTFHPELTPDTRIHEYFLKKSSG